MGSGRIVREAGGAWPRVGKATRRSDYRLCQEARLQQCKPTYYTTSVLHGNENALELYQKLGFRIVEPNAHHEKEGREYLTTKLSIDFQ